MADEGFKRKLTAVLSADAVEYSRLMAEDEAATVKTIASYREIMSSLIKQHRGRVVDSPGDNMLAEFSSVVDAVQCAVAMQNEFQARNAELEKNRQMQFRIGINLGDVIDEDDRIYGDGVNIAARLESLANPGGICVSKTAFDQIETKLPLGYEYLGEQSVKNIPKPVGAYRVLMKPDAAGKVIGEKRFLGRFSRRAALAAIVILVVVAGALIGWNIYLQQSKKVEPASVDKMAYPLPEKPSIAVMPLDNLSGDPEQEYFSDGITEEIITALSKLDQLFVIARNSTFTYKGKPVKVKQVAEELGVRYVLEGSVRKTEDRVRVTAQLIDAISGHHLWAERYDRDLKDIFDLQDEITMKIVTALQIKLTDGEQARIWSKTTENLDFYLKRMEGHAACREGTVEGHIKEAQISQELIDMEPESPIGYASLGHSYWYLATAGKSPRENLTKAFKLTQKALSMDESFASAHAILGSIYTMMRKHEKAIAAGKRAIELDPNGAMVHGFLGTILSFAGRQDEAIGYINKAIRLNPFPEYWYFGALSRCYLLKGQYEDALKAAKKALLRNPDASGNHSRLAVIYALLNRQEEASAATKKALEIDPSLSVERIKHWPFKNQADLKLYADAMRKAGFPE